jgi:hypothetical protein
MRKSEDLLGTLSADNCETENLIVQEYGCDKHCHSRFLFYYFLYFIEEWKYGRCYLGKETCLWTERQEKRLIQMIREMNSVNCISTYQRKTGSGWRNQEKYKFLVMNWPNNGGSVYTDKLSPVYTETLFLHLIKYINESHARLNKRTRGWVVFTLLVDVPCSPCSNLNGNCNREGD